MSLGNTGGIHDPKDPIIYCEGTLEERDSDSDSDSEHHHEHDHEDGSWCCCVPGGHLLRKHAHGKKEDVGLAMTKLEENGAGKLSEDPCACHDDEDNHVNAKAQCQLIIAVIIAFLFMTAEIIGEF